MGFLSKFLSKDEQAQPDLNSLDIPPPPEFNSDIPTLKPEEEKAQVTPEPEPVEPHILPTSERYVQEVLDLATGPIAADRDWAFAELIKLERAGVSIPGLELQGLSEDI